jgi:hypothetical protein
VHVCALSIIQTMHMVLKFPHRGHGKLL